MSDWSGFYSKNMKNWRTQINKECLHPVMSSLCPGCVSNACGQLPDRFPILKGRLKTGQVFNRQHPNHFANVSNFLSTMYSLHGIKTSLSVHNYHVLILVLVWLVYVCNFITIIISNAAQQRKATQNWPLCCDAERHAKPRQSDFITHSRIISFPGRTILRVRGAAKHESREISEVGNDF